MNVLSAATDLKVSMIKRIVTRLIIARLIPVAINAGKKAFRKRKSAVDPKANIGDVTDAPKLDVIDKTSD